MRLFDRYGKLRSALRNGRLHATPKEILPFLRGRLSKSDLPELVIEPADPSELCAVLAFAAEKSMRVAVASGLKPTDVRNLENHLLILTTRLAESPIFSGAHRTTRVGAGLSMESLTVDLTRAGLRWLPLWPVPAGRSPGELFAMGWEGLRNWRDGSTLGHIRGVEWVGYDGTVYHTGSAAITENDPDISGFLFGSRGRMGVITALELDLYAIPEQQTTVLMELPGAPAAVNVMAELRAFEPLPETVVYLGETATQILREGNDFRVSSQATVVLAVEWREAVPEWPSRWASYGQPITEPSAIESLWQDLFRFPRTAARLYPARTEIRLKVPALSLPELEEAARELGREFNLPVALWGTTEAGYVQVWALQPDDQPRTVQHAEELLKKLYEVAVGLDGAGAPGCVLPFDSRIINTNGGHPPLDTIRRKILEKCDPQSLFSPLISS
ncbi:MAG: FAD-binding oxidoreductase [Calditrichota bacterium]